jgi:hypothetical protein
VCLGLAISITIVSAQVITREAWKARPNNRRPEAQLRLPIGPTTLTIGGEIKFEVEWEDNFDLAHDTADAVLETTLSSELEGLLCLSPHLELFGQLKLSSRRFLIAQEGDPEHSADYEMGETWLFLPGLFAGHLGLQIGRQDFDDTREWLYDANLDAVRLFLNFARFRLELAVTEQFFTKVEAAEDDVVNVIGYASYKVAQQTFIDAYVFLRHDHSRRAEAEDRDDSAPIWLGIRSYGRLFDKRVRYWLDVAYLTGKSIDVDEQEGHVEVTTHTLSAYAIDVGVTYVFVGTRWEPSITLGVAFGSGDANPNNGVDRQFRQTGLQDNEDKFNGVQNFQYYGALVDPELSNLWIFTAGVGIKLTDNSSFDLIFHHYLQVERATRLWDTNLEVRPNGKKRHLGNEFDLVFGWILNRRFEVQLDVAAFLPGRAFDIPVHDPAMFVGLELKLNF